MPHPSQIDYTKDNLVPEHMRYGLKLYIDHGILPGGFMTAVLANDLREACARADTINRHRLFEIVSFIYNYVPGSCWGNYEAVDSWRKAGGFEGLNQPVEK